MGVDAFLVKPFDTEKLINALIKIKKGLSTEENATKQIKEIKLSEHTVYDLSTNTLHYQEVPLKLAKKIYFKNRFLFSCV